MTDAANTEVSVLFSDLLRQIHRLSSAELRTVMEMDQRMRRDALERDDVARLRAIADQDGR